MLLHTLAAIGVFLLICGWRLSTVLLVILDDKRERVTFWDETPSAMLHYLLYRPGPNWTDDFNAARGSMFGELSCYVGPLVLVLALLSLASGWRWWHTLTLVCFWLAMGSVRVVSAELLAHGLAVLRLGPRGDSLAIPGACSAWDSPPAACWPDGAPRRGRRFASWRRLFSVIIAADLVVLGHQQFPRAFSDHAQSGHVSGAAGPRHRQRAGRPGLPVRHERLRRDPRLRADAQLLPRRAHASAGSRGSRISRRGLDRQGDRSAGLLEPEPPGLPGRARPGGSRQPESGLLVVGQRPPRVSRTPLRRAEGAVRPSRPTPRVGSSSRSIPAGWKWGWGCTCWVRSSWHWHGHSGRWPRFRALLPSRDPGQPPRPAGAAGPWARPARRKGRPRVSPRAGRSRRRRWIR